MLNFQIFQGNLFENVLADEISKFCQSYPLGEASQIKQAKQIKQADQPTNQQTNQITNQPTNQPINQPTNQPTNQPINQSINQSINQPINQPTNQPINQPTNQPTPPFYHTYIIHTCHSRYPWGWPGTETGNDQTLKNTHFRQIKNKIEMQVKLT